MEARRWSKGLRNTVEAIPLVTYSSPTSQSVLGRQVLAELG